MRSPLRIRSFPATTLEGLANKGYDGVLASLGFERRSRDIPAGMQSADNAVAIPFEDRHEAAYAENKKWFDDHDWNQPEIDDDSDYFGFVDGWLRERVAAAEGHAHVAVDVSSTTRARMAAVVEAILNLPRETRLDVDFLYAPAAFEEPSDEDEPPVFNVAPVSGYFAGWWNALEDPLYAIIGVGYELERASSAINTLEPEMTEVYVAHGSDERYLREVRKSNRSLMTTKGVRREEVLYDVSDPFSCFHQLEASISRLEKENRVALVPLGPKIFAVCAILAAGLHLDRAQVIRVSAGERQRAVNRKGDGNVYGLTVALSPYAQQRAEDPPAAARPKTTSGEGSG